MKLDIPLIAGLVASLPCCVLAAPSSELSEAVLADDPIEHILHDKCDQKHPASLRLGNVDENKWYDINVIRNGDPKETSMSSAIVIFPVHSRSQQILAILDSCIDASIERPT